MQVLLDKLELPTSSFSCGPGQGLDSVRNTPLHATHFERSHRANDVVDMYRETTEMLRTLLNIPADHTVLFFPGGATAAMDSVLWSLARQHISGVEMGAFSHLFCQTLAARVPDIKRHFVTAGADFIPRELPDTNTSLVLLTPNETSTGVQLPDDYLLEVWHTRGENTLVVWDATSCAGGRNLPSGAYDVLLFGLQKCFGAGGGTCCMVLSPQAVARAKQNTRAVPYLLDLNNALAYADKFQTLNTPSTINIWMTHEACAWMLAHGGLAAMDKLCRQHADYLVHWAQKSPYFKPLISDEKYRSFTTLTLAITHPQITGAQIARALLETGRPNLADGLKKYRTVAQESLRIACFPFVDSEGVEQYQKLTAVLDEIARQIGNTPEIISNTHN